MTEILFNDDDPILTSNDANHNQTILLPNLLVVVDESSSSSLVRKDSIVIPSISNHSISSVIQIDNHPTNSNTLLPVPTSNSLGKRTLSKECRSIGFCFSGDLSSTPLLMVENPNSNNAIVQQDQLPPTTATTFIECRSFPIDSSSSSSLTSSQSQQVRSMETNRLIRMIFVYFSHRLLMNY